MSLDPDDALIGNWFSANAGNANQPPGEDQRSQGDDQIRRLKGTVRRHFPAFTGSSAAPKTVNASEDQLNGLSDYVPGNGTVESRLATLEAESAKFPGGNTVYLAFHNQVSAIPGWTQQTDPAYDGAMLRVINDASAIGTGGTANPVSMAGSDVPQHPHNLSINNDSHRHRLLSGYSGGGGGGRSSIEFKSQTGVGDTPIYVDLSSLIPDPYVENDSHNHTGTADNNAGPLNWEPKYFDGIVASKD